MNDTPQILFARRPANQCIYADCTDRASYHEMPICRLHASQAWKAFEDTESEAYKQHIRGDAEELIVTHRATQELAKQKKQLHNQRPGTIYYLQVADRVKIGFTTDLYQRMMHYPPNSELLATHPGTPMLEREMHSRFVQHLADGREWFHPNEKLTEHIERVRATYPLKATIAQMRQPVGTPGTTLRPRTSSMARRV